MNNENRRQILEMLAQGKITSDEAERLIAALEKEPAAAKPKYLRVVVESEDESWGNGPSKVNVRIPMQLLRAGVKLASLIPAQAREQVNRELKKNGVEIDITQIKPENLEEIIDHLNDLTVDVNDRNNKVRVFCE